MKMFILFLISVTLLVFGIVMLSGCGMFRPQLGPPNLGEYHYTTHATYTGPTLRTIPIWIDIRFTYRDLILINKAVDDWNMSLNGYIKLRVVDDQFAMEPSKIVSQVKRNGWLIMQIDSKSTIIPGNSDPRHWSLAFANCVGGNHIYFVRDRIRYPSDMFGISLHEIGHLLGAPHVGERLMFPRFTRARFRCIDWTTAWTVATYNHIPADRLNYCVDGNVSRKLESFGR